MYEDNYTDSLGYRRNTMDAALTGLFSYTNAETARDINNKVLAFVNQIESELKTTKKELSAFKKNNEELIQRHNAAISSWDEERERALREAARVKEWREKYEDLERYIRFIGKQIPCNTGGTFENDTIDAILDAAVRALNQHKKDIKNITEAVDAAVKEYSEHNKLAHDKTLDNLEYAIERTKVFEAIADMLYKAEYDNADAIKKIYETVREKYPVGTYYPPCKANLN